MLSIPFFVFVLDRRSKFTIHLLKGAIHLKIDL